jgi:hypothetical protein
MGSHSKQAIGVTAFLMGFTALPVGIVWGEAIYYLLSLALLIVSIVLFLKCKPLEEAED